MKIGLIGAGSIGKTIARMLSASGHDVKVTNSRGPETIDASLLENGARAVRVEEIFADVEVAILSIPPTSFSKVKGLISALPKDAVLIDTSNYYPHRDGKIAAIEAGQIEAEWTREQLGRSLVKAWNAITADSFAEKGSAKGTANRIAIPVAGDSEHDRQVALALVEDTGFRKVCFG